MGARYSSDEDSPILQSSEEAWAVVPRYLLIAWLVFFGAFLYQLTRGAGMLLIMDNVFVPIHEGGHLLFRYLGTTASIAGGTFLQLFVPFALAAYFARRRHTQGVAFCLFFLFEQCLPIAAYMADARAQALPLVSVGASEYVIHDWTYLFTKLGVLSYDTQIAGAVRSIGWMGMICVVLWLLWHGLNDVPRRSPSEPR